MKNVGLAAIFSFWRGENMRIGVVCLSPIFVAADFRDLSFLLLLLSQWVDSGGTPVQGSEP
jgi:hypothetical protein